jgi:hypothetical protein
MPPVSLRECFLTPCVIRTVFERCQSLSCPWSRNSLAISAREARYVLFDSLIGACGGSNNGSFHLSTIHARLLCPMVQPSLSLHKCHSTNQRLSFSRGAPFWFCRLRDSIHFRFFVLAIDVGCFWNQGDARKCCFIQYNSAVDAFCDMQIGWPQFSHCLKCRKI